MIQCIHILVQGDWAHLGLSTYQRTTNIVTINVHVFIAVQGALDPLWPLAEYKWTTKILQCIGCSAGITQMLGVNT